MSSQLRQAALQLALAAGPEATAATVARATAYFDFLNTASPDAIAAATPAVTKPAAKAVKATPAAPVVEEETVTERPTLTGGPTSDESASSSAASAEEQSDATAASGSAAEQPSEDAPSADDASDTPDVTVVNAAVMKAVGKIGKDKTVAILKGFGGSKVPEVPVEQHAALLAALTDAVA